MGGEVDYEDSPSKPFVTFWLSWLFFELLLIRMRACTRAGELLWLSSGQCVKWGGPWVLVVIKAIVCLMATAVPGTVLGTFISTQIIFTTYDGCKAALLTSSPAAHPSTCSALAALAFLLFLLHTIGTPCKVLKLASSFPLSLCSNVISQSSLSWPSLLKSPLAPPQPHSLFIPFIIHPDSIF